MYFCESFTYKEKMLGLKLATDPKWVNIVESNIEEILTDHAWCEQKAATNIITIITYNSEHEELVTDLLEIAKEESVETVSQDLRGLAGLTVDLIAKLAEAGVHTRDDLADLATDELTDITDQTAEEATALIMKAREHWFTSDDSQQTS